MFAHEHETWSAEPIANTRTHTQTHLYTYTCDQAKWRERGRRLRENPCFTISTCALFRLFFFLHGKIGPCRRRRCHLACATFPPIAEYECGCPAFTRGTGTHTHTLRFLYDVTCDVRNCQICAMILLFIFDEFCMACCMPIDFDAEM